MFIYILLKSSNLTCFFNVIFEFRFKIIQTFVTEKLIVSMVVWVNKWLLLGVFSFAFYMSGGKPQEIKVADTASIDHPMHIAVIEVNHNSTDKTLEISCKLFRDDFEKVLAQNYKTRVDLINPKDRTAMERLVNDYIQKHFNLKADGKPVIFSGIGFERENEVVYSYFQADNISSVKKIGISTTMLHDLFSDQVNIIHVIVGGDRKSLKLEYPDKEGIFAF